MKFNLIFFYANNKRPDFGKIDSFLKGLNEIRVETDNDVIKYIYKNPITRVNGELIFIAKYLNDSALKPYNFPGFSQSPLHFHVDVQRPSFFAAELMPFITEFTTKFELYIYDPQSNTIRTPAIHPTSELIESWEKQNKAVICSIKKKQMSLNLYMPRKSADDWWKYMYQLEDLRKKTPVDVVFPDLLILQDNRTSEPVRTVPWIDFMPIAIPECDYISIIETKGVYSSMFLDLGIYEYNAFIELYSNFFKEMMILDRKFKVINDESVEELANEIHEKLNTIESYRSKRFSFISAEKIIDFAC